MPDAADLMVTRIEDTTADLIRFGSNELADSDVVTKIVDQLSAMIKSGNATLVLDISDVAHLSSEMLGGLITVHKEATEKNGGVHLLGPTPNVLTMLNVSKLDHIFSIHATLEAAVASV